MRLQTHVMAGQLLPVVTANPNDAERMPTIDELVLIWDEIDRAESCLVSCLFEEAASLSSSILGRLIENYNPSHEGCEISEDYEFEWHVMLESTGMVLVQSMKQLQRTSEILKELKLLFGSLTAVPVLVFHTGVCFQMSECPSAIQGSLEEFLNNWRYLGDRYYPVLSSEARISDTERSRFRLSIEVDQYLEIVDLYVIKLLAMTKKDRDLAISWVEKAMLPTEKHQELLRRLQLLNSSKVTCPSQTTISPQQPNGYGSSISQDHPLYNGKHKDVESKHVSRDRVTRKEDILKLSRHKVPYLRWFPIISLKIGNIHIVVPNGKVLLALFLFLFYYYTRKKQVALKRFLAEKAMSLKRALSDLWKLAFSYQVNPLAAVQPLPTATRGNH